MKYHALTLKAPGIAQSIIIPVIVNQSEILCRKFNLKKIDADVLALVDTGATNTSIRVPPDSKHIDYVLAANDNVD